MIEDSWFHPDPKIRVSETVFEERQVFEEQSETLVGTDLGTRYIKLKLEDVRLSSKTVREIKAT